MCWLSPCNSSGGCSVYQHPSCWRTSTQPRGAWPGSEGSAGAGAERQKLDPFTARGAEGRGDPDSPPLGGRLGAACPFPWGSWGGNWSPGAELAGSQGSALLPQSPESATRAATGCCLWWRKVGGQYEMGGSVLCCKVSLARLALGCTPRSGLMVPWSQDHSRCKDPESGGTGRAWGARVGQKADTTKAAPWWKVGVKPWPL